MQEIALFEDAGFVNLLPLAYWKTVFGLRCGRKTLLDRTSLRLGRSVGGLWTRDWLAGVAAERYMVPVNAPANENTVLVNGRWLVEGAIEFQPGPFAGTCDEQIVYLACDAELAKRLTPADLLDGDRCQALLDSIEHAPVEASLINFPWDLVANNAAALEGDWMPGERGIEGKVSSSAHLIEPDMIYVGPGAEVGPLAVIDASAGPVYISQNVTIRPLACVTGPAYIGPGSVLNTHCQVRGGTSLGPVCKVGGEIINTIMAGYSNKQHEGFLGHSYVGSWVNLGAGTVNSNLKNTYGPVRVPINGREVDTGQTLFGSIIGDHVKLGIAQTLPTGVSIGFGSMVSCSRILPKFVPSFAWLTDGGRVQADPKRLLATARKVMERRQVTCTEAEATLFCEIARRAGHYEQP